MSGPRSTSARPEEVAVVGAAGFIGSALVARLRYLGVTVSAFTRGAPFYVPASWSVGGGSRRTVVWAAGSTDPGLAESRPDLVDADEQGFAAVVHTAAGMPHPPRIVLISSGGTVYDPSTMPPYSETSPTAPTTAYGRMKLRMEQLLAGAGLPDGEATAVRVANAYGPGQPARPGQGVIAHWLLACAEGRRPVLYGRADTVRDFVYVDDLVDALVACHRVDRLPGIVNVGSGVPTSLGELRAIVAATTGVSIDETDAGVARTFDTPGTWLDIGLARAELAWQPATPLATGVARAWRAVAAEHPGGASGSAGSGSGTHSTSVP